MSHEAAIEKETSGLDMYLPLGQQPSRPLLLSKTFDKVDHLPPHNVRLNPLEWNTEKGEKDIVNNNILDLNNNIL